MSSTDYPDFSIFKKFYQDLLASHLQHLHGDKDLVLDEELMKPLDQITGVTFLRKHGVQKIYNMQPGGIEQGCDKRIFIIRPYTDRMRTLAAYINLDKNKGITRQYHVILTPTKLSTCSIILEKEGVYGDVTLSDFPLDMIQLDVDLLSMEMPLCYKQFFLESDTTWNHSIARGISTIEGTFGGIPKIYCIGGTSQSIRGMINMRDERSFTPPGGPEIGCLIMVDRNIDHATVLTSQLTYEGLVAETFGINSGIVKLGKEVTNSDQTASLTLNSTDKVFSEIRGMHITGVFPLLSSKARQLQSGYDKKDQLSTVSDFKQFVSEDLKELKQQHRSLALHIGACEAIMNKKTENLFEECLLVEQSLLEDVNSKDSINYVETCIQRQDSSVQCLRLLSMLSTCKGGIDSKLYKNLKAQYLHSFGFKHILTFKKLKQLGLFNESNDKRNLFPKARKKLNLIPKSPEATAKNNIPKEISYVFGGAYSPFIVKLIELFISKGFIGNVEESLKMLQIPADEYKGGSARQSGGSMKLSPTALKTVLVVFVGGCTHTEINALRFVGRQLGYKFVILTTAIVTADQFLEAIIK